MNKEKMNRILLKAIKEKVKKGVPVSIKLFGHSMYPVFCDGENINIIYWEFDDIQINDIIAYCNDFSQHFIVHRVVKIDNINGEKILITQGDNNKYVDAKAVRRKNFVGKIINGEF